ncbi:hypothetical protein [Methylibium sp.]|uniref:hypothetical protein n=1 Tax=Methylibium sp. TaxID=2067992 RepID=UPI0017E4DB29|nr:hypothetical protein [Methylibium sp.]MBA3588920.1 hypothetical protein [Methylibium sp.]
MIGTTDAAPSRSPAAVPALDLTWLTDANAGAGSSFDDGLSNSDGRMSWTSANAWAAALVVDGVAGWRLPTLLGGTTTVSEI